MNAGSVELEPSLIGQRLTLRLHDPEGGFRDLVGVLESLTTIRKRNGELVEFDPEALAIVHPIEDVEHKAGKGAPLSIRITELEELSTRTWPPLRTENLGQWRIRISDGLTYRANSVLVLGPPPFGDPGLGIDEAIATVERMYNEAKLPPTFQCVHPLYTELIDFLLARGWREKVGAAFLISDIENTIDNCEKLKQRGFEILNESAPTAEFLALHGDEILESIMNSYPARYISIKNGNETVATARVAIENSWAILTRLFVSPTHRRQGLAEELMLASLLIAKQEGANKMCLQLDRSNTAAAALYEKLGFRIHHTYSFIEREVRDGCAC